MIGEEPFNVTEDNSKVTVEDNGMWIDIITTVPTEDGEEEVERQSIDPSDLNKRISEQIYDEGIVVDKDDIELIEITDLGDGYYEFSINFILSKNIILSLNELRKLVK